MTLFQAATCWMLGTKTIYQVQILFRDNHLSKGTSFPFLVHFWAEYNIHIMQKNITGTRSGHILKIACLPMFDRVCNFLEYSIQNVLACKAVTVYIRTVSSQPLLSTLLKWSFGHSNMQHTLTRFTQCVYLCVLQLTQASFLQKLLIKKGHKPTHVFKTRIVGAD